MKTVTILSHNIPGTFQRERKRRRERERNRKRERESKKEREIVTERKREIG